MQFSILMKNEGNAHLAVPKTNAKNAWGLLKVIRTFN
jgi:hypothetical protein